MRENARRRLGVSIRVLYGPPSPIDGKLAGEFVPADELASRDAEFLRDLKALGLERAILATGERCEVAELVVAGSAF